MATRRTRGQISASHGLPRWTLAGPITWGLLPLLPAPRSATRWRTTAWRCATASALAWATWAVVLVAVVLPTTVNLTALRIAAPAALAVANGAAITGEEASPAAVAVRAAR